MAPKQPAGKRLTTHYTYSLHITHYFVSGRLLRVGFVSGRLLRVGLGGRQDHVGRHARVYMQIDNCNMTFTRSLA